MFYHTTNRDGYQEYRSDPRVCINCPTRYMPEYQGLYHRRKESIEQVFADAKEKHAMRDTRYRGLSKVSNWMKLKFAAMNLKKLARWLWEEKSAALFWSLYDGNPAYA